MQIYALNRIACAYYTKTTWCGRYLSVLPNFMHVVKLQDRAKCKCTQLTILMSLNKIKRMWLNISVWCYFTALL